MGYFPIELSEKVFFIDERRLNIGLAFEKDWGIFKNNRNDRAQGKKKGRKIFKDNPGLIRKKIIDEGNQKGLEMRTSELQEILFPSLKKFIEGTSVGKI